MKRPLEGYLVLDLTTALAGPYATLLLAGLGARVIKVENPSTGGDPARNNSPYIGEGGLSLRRTAETDQSVSHLARGRNKESLTLDLKTAEGRRVFLELAARADVVVENYSAGVTERLGISFEALKEINPSIVYTSISGFGADHDGSRAMDTIIQALSGVMLTAGDPDGPPVRMGLPIADLLAPLFAVIATVSTLLDAERSGSRTARHVDVSMLGSLTSLIAAEPYGALEALGVPTRTGQFVPRLAPFGVFPTTDGWIAICGPLDKFAHGLLSLLNDAGQPLGTEYVSRDGRVEHAAELHEEISAWTSTRTTDDAVADLEAAGVPAGPVRHPTDAVRDPRVLRRNEVVDLGDSSPAARGIYGPGLPFLISGMDLRLDQAAPVLGADSEKILSSLLGFEPDRIDELKRAGVL